jgi:hypothetical protein
MNPRFSLMSLPQILGKSLKFMKPLNKMKNLIKIILFLESFIGYFVFLTLKFCHFEEKTIKDNKKMGPKLF